MGNSHLQARLVVSPVRRSNVDTVDIALFDANGVGRTVPIQAAARTDVGAVTSVVAAGATPTKAEYDALRVDVLAIRTVLNDLLAKLRTSGAIAP